MALGNPKGVKGHRVGSMSFRVSGLRSEPGRMCLRWLTCRHESARLLYMSKSTKRTKAIDLRPFSAVARRHAKASTQVGTFGHSEGYEIKRLCYNDRIAIAYNVAHHGSSFWADADERSKVEGKKVLEAIMATLIAEGYEVAWDEAGLYGLQIIVTVAD